MYRAAARWLSRTFLNVPVVQSVLVRRSVAAGEAEFPWSDLDLAIVIGPATGREVDALRQRYHWARTLFPRLGECQVFTAGDLVELSETDPYRASLDRRCCVTVLGETPVIPAVPVPLHEAARRLVFWFDSYVPRALAQGNGRNLRKFTLEMANALGVVEGRWAEPLTSRRETEQQAGTLEDDPLEAGFQMAARAHRVLRAPAPQLARPLELPGLVVVRSAAEAPRTGVKVMTAEVLDLMLETQNPKLWSEHGAALAAAGFCAPSRESWRRAARRWAAGERVRGPGFLEHGTVQAFERLKTSAEILGVPGPDVPHGLSVSRYYRERYEPLNDLASALRAAASLHRSVGDRQPPVDDREAFAQLVFRD